MTERRSKAFAKFERFVKNARIVIALDARMKSRTMRFLSKHRLQNSTRCVINGHIPKRGQMHVIHLREEFYSQLIRNAASVKPGVVITNTKKEALTIAEILKSNFKVVGPDVSNVRRPGNRLFSRNGVPAKSPVLRVLEINSTTMKSPEMKELAANATFTWPKFGIVIYTPSVSAGISCNTDYFKWGMIYAVQCSTNVDGLVQQIGRVRQLREFFLYLAPSFVDRKTLPICRRDIDYYFQTNLKRIQRRNEPTHGAEILEAHRSDKPSRDIEIQLSKHTRDMFGTQLGDHVQYEWTADDTPLVSIILDNISLRNRDRRDYECRLYDALTEVGFQLGSFDDYLQSNGLEPITAEIESQWKRDIADSTVKHWKDARDKLRELPSIDTETIDAIRRKKPQTLTAEEALFVRRDTIFNTYNISAFPKQADRFIELHVEGQGIKQFTNFCLMVVPSSQGNIYNKLRTKHGGDGRLNPVTIPNMVTEQGIWAGKRRRVRGYS